MRASVLSAFVLAAALTLTGVARADDQAELDKGRNAYLGRQYDEADRRFRDMLDPQHGTIHDPLLVNQAYMYWGAVMVALSKNKDASGIFEQLLKRDGRFEPDPLSFPTAVLDVFSDTKNRMKDQINAAAQEAARLAEEKRKRDEADKMRQAARVAALEQLATTETTIEHHSRWIAFVPFGAGQFQNGKPVLGWTFLIGESVLGVAAGVTGAISLAKSSDAQDIYAANPTKDNPSVTAPANDARNASVNWRYANLSCAGAFVAVAILGVIQANVEFQTEVLTVKKKPLPPALREGARVDWHFTAAPVSGERSTSSPTGATFGIVGSF